MAKDTWQATTNVGESIENIMLKQKSKLDKSNSLDIIGPSE